VSSKRVKEKHFFNSDPEENWPGKKLRRKRRKKEKPGREEDERKNNDKPAKTLCNKKQGKAW